MKFLIFNFLFFASFPIVESPAQDHSVMGEVVYFIELEEVTTTTQQIINDKIIAAFRQEFTPINYYFFYSKNRKKILDGEYENILFDQNGAKKKLGSAVFKGYVINFGIGHPKDGFERYNHEGFSLMEIKNQELQNTGIYGGASFKNLGLGKYRDYQKGVQILVKKMFQAKRF